MGKKPIKPKVTSPVIGYKSITKRRFKAVTPLHACKIKTRSVQKLINENHSLDSSKDISQVQPLEQLIEELEQEVETRSAELGTTRTIDSNRPSSRPLTSAKLHKRRYP